MYLNRRCLYVRCLPSRTNARFYTVFYAFQDQLVYMRGLILKHVQKPMTRDQVCLLCKVGCSHWFTRMFTPPCKWACFLLR